MEMLTTREAADRAGCTVRQWHWLVEKFDVHPAKELPGLRGAKLWATDVVADVIARRDAAEAGAA